MKLTPLGIYGPYPRAGGACSSYAVEAQGTLLIMDMGAGALSRLLAYTDVSRIKYIWISHFHFDHTSDLLPLHYLLAANKQNVEIICPKPHNDYAKTVLDSPHFQVTTVQEGDVLSVGALRLSFFEMTHPVPTLAVRVEGDKVLTYTGDTTYNDNISRALAGADVALLDCSKPAGFVGPHMTVENARKLAAGCTARLIATHLNPDYNPTDDLKGSGITVAAEGKSLEF